MSDIKSELTGRLDEAKVRYEDARKEYENARHEVELMAGLIAEFQRLTAQDTRAFPAVPPAPPAERRPLNPQNMVAVGCGNCGQQISRNMPDEQWRHNDGCVECPIPGGTYAEPYLDPPAQPAPASSEPAGPTPPGQIIAEHPLNATRPDPQETPDA